MERALTEILPPTPAGLAQAADCLRSGGIVGIPTETVYGLAAAVGDEAAVARVFAAKARPLMDPLIVHLADPADLGRIADLDALGELARERVRRLGDALWPGPLTLVLPRRPEVPDLVAAGLQTVAVRVPAHPLTRELIRSVAPLVAPSANRFGRISPTTAEDVVRELGGRVPYVLDGGPCTVGVESTIVGVRPDGSLVLLRPGGAPAERIEAVAGAPLGAAGPGISAPGQLPSHYAPRTRLVLAPDRLSEVDPAWLGSQPGPVAVLVAQGAVEPVVARLRELGLEVVGAAALSADGDAEEAARRLFSALRELDGSGAARILAEPWPGSTGLGRALQDRLARASAEPSEPPEH